MDGERARKASPAQEVGETRSPPGWTRREMIRGAALALTAAGAGVFNRLDPLVAQHVHSTAQEATQADGSYAPRCFNVQEYKTLSRLSELILPADDVSGSAVDAGVPEFIDLLASENEELARIFTGGILWLDHQMGARVGSRFITAPPADQTAMLDLLAEDAQEDEEPAYESYAESLDYAGFQDYTTEAPSPLAGGLRFFGWLRRLTVDGFYTSPMGIEDVGYQGNGYRTKYEVPQEAIDFALERSPFRNP